MIKPDLARNDLHRAGISNFSEQVLCQSEVLKATSRAILPALLALCVWAPRVRAQPLPALEAAPAAELPAAPPPKDVGKKEAASEPAEAGSDGDDDGGSGNALSLRARAMVGFEYERERPSGAQGGVPEKEYGFILKQVRIGVRGELSELFRINTSFELSDAVSPETGASYTSPMYIRTATLDYRPSKSFRLKLGRFKRPFSRIELESAADLPILDRGLFNDLAIEDNQWGDRAVGAMASGRIKAPKLRWYLSLTNPAWRSNLPTEGLDVMGRVEWSVLDALTVGVNGGYKNILISDDRVHASAFGGDLDLELGNAGVVLELSSVDLPFRQGRPRGLAALLLFRYLLDVTPLWALQPTFFAEVADADAQFSQTESLRLVSGVNLIGHGDFRVMPQVSVVRSLGDTSAQNPWRESETYTLIFSLVL